MAGKHSRVLAGVRAPPERLLACPSGPWADSQSCLQCHLSATPPPSPKSHSTRSGSFVVGVLINFILINSVISSCLQNLHWALLRDGSVERGCRQTHDSFLCWCYIYLTLGRGWAGERSRKAACLLVLNVISQLPSAHPVWGLQTVVGGQTPQRLSCRQVARLGVRDVSPTSTSSFLRSLSYFA